MAALTCSALLWLVEIVAGPRPWQPWRVLARDLPVLTIRGVLTRDGIAQVAPMMLERGLDDGTIAALKALLNPTVVGLIEATGGDLRQMIIEKLTPALTASLTNACEPGHR